MSSKLFFAIMLLGVKVVTICFTLLLFYWVSIHLFTESAAVEVTYDFADNSQYISGLDPWQRLYPREENDGVWSQRVKDDLVYFNVRHSGWFEKVAISITFKNENNNLVELGGKINDAEAYQVLPFQNKYIDGLDWKRVSNGAVTLYQKSQNYDSINTFITDFSNNKLQDAKIGQYSYRLPDNNLNTVYSVDDSSIESLDYIITEYVSPKAENDWFIQSQVFEIDRLYKENNGNMRFRISIPGLNKAGSSIEIREIKVRFEKPEVTLNNFPHKLKSYLSKMVGKI